MTAADGRMRAWVLQGRGQALARVERPVPDPQRDEVLIEVRAAGICHSDVGYCDGTLTPRLGFLPIILGHEVAGEVMSVGSHVHGLQPGARVAVNAGMDGPGTAIDGGFASHVIARARDVVHIPHGVDFDQAATATDAGRTAFHAVRTVGSVGRHTRVGIVGYGGLGSLAAEIALELGAEVYVAEINEALHKAITARGVHAVSSRISDFADAGLEVIVDLAGFGGTTADSLTTVAPGGRVVQVGLGRQHATIDVQDLVIREVSLLPSLAGSNDDVTAVLDLMARGRIASRIVQTSFEDIPSSLDRLARGEIVGRLVAVLR